MKRTFHSTCQLLAMIVVFAVMTTAVLTTSVHGQSQNIVQLEVLIDSSIGPARSQEWMETLSRVGADSVSMRSARTGDKIKISSSPSGDYDTIQLVGQVTRNGQLVLPGGTFSKRDISGMKSLIETIRIDGAENALSEKKAFGLTSKQLVQLHKDLSGIYSSSTKGVAASEIIASIKENLPVQLDMSRTALASLVEDYTIEDELSGLSYGTVLAAVTRPLGLVAAPQRPQGGEILIVIADSEEVEEHWPIGWPSDKPKTMEIPALGERFSLRIENIPLRGVLDAIQAKCEVPFIYDYNSLAASGADLQETTVSLTETRITRMRAVSKLLSNSRLRLGYEVRLDEAGNPFLWISSLN